MKVQKDLLFLHSNMGKYNIRWQTDKQCNKILYSVIIKQFNFYMSAAYDDVSKSKGIPRQTEMVLGVPGRLRPRIFSNFGTTRVVGRQPNAPAAFTPGEIPGTHFQRLSRPQVLSEGTTEKIPSDTTGDSSRDRPTSSAAP